MKRLIAVRLPNLPYNPSEQSFRVGEARMPIAAVLAGLRGADGLPGVSGPVGPTGPAGATGPAGDSGPQGPQGIQGVQGEQGPQGIQGVQGPQGEQGPVGPQGETGPQGPAGPQGAQGPQGEQGPHGAPFRIAQTYASVAALTADTSRDDGDFGLVVSDDIDPDNGKLFCFSSGSWSFIVDMAGQPGIQGPTGPQGPVGPQGEQGPQGIQGPTGPQGPQGIQGLTGATGPQGPQGIQGPTGATGATGPAGPGVADGGTAGQVLTKIDGTDYNTQWTAITSALLTGLASGSATAIAAADTILQALEKLQAQASANAANISTNSNLLAPVPRKIGPSWYVSGRWYDLGYPYGFSIATQSVPGGVVRYFAYSPLETVTLQNIATNISGAMTAGGTMKFGIYANNNGFPAARIYASSAIAGDTTGVKTAACTQTLTAGTVYWFGIFVSATAVFSANLIARTYGGVVAFGIAGLTHSGRSDITSDGAGAVFSNAGYAPFLSFQVQ